MAELEYAERSNRSVLCGVRVRIPPWLPGAMRPPRMQNIRGRRRHSSKCRTSVCDTGECGRRGQPARSDPHARRHFSCHNPTCRPACQADYKYGGGGAPYGASALDRGWLRISVNNLLTDLGLAMNSFSWRHPKTWSGMFVRCAVLTVGMAALGSIIGDVWEPIHGVAVSCTLFGLWMPDTPKVH